MTIRKTLIMLSIVFLALWGPAIAEQEAPANISGLGAFTCKELLSKVGNGMGRNNPDQYALMQWAVGFASGMNVMRGRSDTLVWNLSAITYDEIWAGIIGNCKRNGDQMAAKAVFDTIEKIPLIDSRDVDNN